MGPRSHWTNEEIAYLEENWGKYRVAVIANKLNRTVKAVILKAKRLSLGPSKYHQGELTASQLAQALGVDIHTITDYWIPKCGLKAKRKITRSKQRFCLIDINDFWIWAKDNQDKFDSRRFEPLTLGIEPEWMKLKRKRDLKLPARRLQKWTQEEDNKARYLYKSGKNYAEIGKIIGRSRAAVQRRLSRIGIWEEKKQCSIK